MTRRAVDPTHADVQLAVQVSDLPSAQRVLTLLVARGYALARFSAARQREGSWSVQVDCRVCDSDLLVARLLRFPTVLEVSLTALPEPPAR